MVHQENYVKSVLEKNGMQDANPSKTTGECGETPEETAKKVKDREKKKRKNNKEIAHEEEQKREVNKETTREAQKAVGELIWLVTRSRLDIAYTVHRAATFTRTA